MNQINKYTEKYYLYVYVIIYFILFKKYILKKL